MRGGVSVSNNNAGAAAGGGALYGLGMFRTPDMVRKSVRGQGRFLTS